MKKGTWEYPIMKNVVDYMLTGDCVESRGVKHIVGLKKDGERWKPKDAREKIEIENIKNTILHQIKQKAITLKCTT